MLSWGLQTVSEGADRGERFSSTIRLNRKN